VVRRHFLLVFCLPVSIASSSFLFPNATVCRSSVQSKHFLSKHVEKEREEGSKKDKHETKEQNI
jgi:hypothetical protein